MKKVLVFSLLVLGFMSPVFASCGCANGSNVESTINVSATSTKEVVPDTVEINIEVQTSNPKSMQIASNENSEISQKVLNGMKDFLNTANGDYVKTAYFRADTRYKYINQKQVFDAYQVTNTIIVHTKDISRISEIIEKAIKDGATGVSNLNFSLSCYDKYKNDLIAEAIKKAESQAKVASHAANSELSKIKSINVANNGFGHARNTVLNYKAAGAHVDSVESSSFAPSIEPGIIKIQADVNIVYYIK